MAKASKATLAAEAAVENVQKALSSAPGGELIGELRAEEDEG